MATSGSGRRAARRRKATTFANCDHDAAPLTRLCPCGAAVPVWLRRLGSSARLSNWDWAGVGGYRRFCGGAGARVQAVEADHRYALGDMHLVHVGLMAVRLL